MMTTTIFPVPIKGDSFEIAFETTETVESTEALGDPCIIPGNEIAAIIGWEGKIRGVPNAINSADIQGCGYNANLKGDLAVLFQRFSSTINDGKYLESSYEKSLVKSNEDFRQLEISGYGDQAIYDFGKVGPNYYRI